MGGGGEEGRCTTRRRHRPLDVAGMYGGWVESPDADRHRVLFYLHGGGYRSGSCVTHRDLAARLSLESGAARRHPGFGRLLATLGRLCTLTWGQRHAP
jgi:hypothetical protein